MRHPTLEKEDLENTTTESLLERLRLEQPLHTTANSSVTGRPLFSASRYYNNAKYSQIYEDSGQQGNASEACAESEEDDEDFCMNRTRSRESRLDSVAFQNLVVDNSDEVMIEARNLLRQWIENDPVPIENDVSFRVKHQCTSKAGDRDDQDDRSSIDAHEIRRILHEVVGIEQTPAPKPTAKPTSICVVKKPSENTTTTSSRISTSIRQSLAKHRREMADFQRAAAGAVVNQKNIMIHKQGKDEKRLAIVNKWEAEVSLTSAKAELEEVLKEARSKAQQEQEKAMEAKKEQQRLEDLARYEREQLRRANEERERKRTIGMARAEELFMLKCLKTISPLFSAWRDHTLRQKMSLNSVLVLGNWKLKNRAWVKWVTTKKRREGVRHSEALTRDLKKAHENQTKADRHYRLTTLSKVYLAWHAWHKIEMENKKLQRRHQERSKKVQDFLKAMEEQVENARRRPLSPLSPPSPPPPPPATIVQNISSSHTIPFCNVADICGAERFLRDTCPHTSKSTTIKVRKGKLRQIDSVAKQQPPFTIIIPAPSPITAAAAAAAAEPININSTSHAPTKPKPAAIIKSLKNPDILQQMKKREAERIERRNAVEQKKREREQEIQAKKDQEERERIEREETEKRRYIELKMEERRLRKMAEEEKEKEKEKRAQNLAKAISHYHKTLLKRKGLTPLKINVACHRHDEALALAFRQKWDCLPSVLKWRRKLQDKREQVELQASLVYEKNLVCRVWKEFSQKYKTEKSKESLAQSYYINQTSHSVFAKWIQKAKESVFTRLQNEREKERKAVLLAEKLMPRRYLRKWRAIVAELKEEQCREWRREQLRSRIKEMLTVSKFEEKLKRDYTPPMRRGFAVDLDE